MVALPDLLVGERQARGDLAQVQLLEEAQAHDLPLGDVGDARQGFLDATRILLAPSLWQEPFGRVAAESLVNAVPPVVSDRGGLPEAAAEGGFVLPIPDTITPRTRQPPESKDVGAWTDLAVRLMTDDAFYADMKRKCATYNVFVRPACYSLAWTYYQAVRAFGTPIITSDQLEEAARLKAAGEALMHAQAI